jgi:hypothetical protein
MTKEFARSIDRRDFLHLGVLAGLGYVAGCAEEVKPTEATTPPVLGGNRKQLEKFTKRPMENPAKKAD